MADSKREVKIQRLINLYNISEEEASYIIYTDDVYLDIEDLKMKYNNLDMGKLPDWLTDDMLHNVICSSIKSHMSEKLMESTSFNDLYQDLQLFVRMRSHKIINYNYLHTMINNYLLNHISTNVMIKKYVPTNLDDPIIKNVDDTNDVSTYGEFIASNTKDDDILLLINSVSDKNVRKFLIVVGYLLCEINALENLYEDVINNSKDSVKENLKNIEEDLVKNDLIKDKQKYGESVGGIRKKTVSARTIIAALELDKYTFDTIECMSTSKKKKVKSVKLSSTAILDEFRYYLTNMGTFRAFNTGM